MGTDDKEEGAPTPASAARRSSNLIALATAAVLTVYAAGYARTKEAADRFDVADAERGSPDAGGRGGRDGGRGAQVAPASNADTKIAAKPVEAPAKRAAPLSTAPTVADTQPKAEPAAAVAAAPASAAPTLAAAPAPISISALSSKNPEPVSVATVKQAPVSAPASAVYPEPPSTPTAMMSRTPAQTGSATAASAKQQTEKIKWKDGTYSGWGTSRHGDIQASVQIAGGEIVNAWISQCLTQYSCSWIERLPPQVITRQSGEVDYVSGATQSANAFYFAIQGALRAAK